MHPTDPTVRLLGAIDPLSDLSRSDLRHLCSHGTVLDRRPGQGIGESCPPGTQVVVVLSGSITVGPRGPIAATQVTVFVVSNRELRSLLHTAPQVVQPLLEAATRLDLLLCDQPTRVRRPQPMRVGGPGGRP